MRLNCPHCSQPITLTVRGAKKKTSPSPIPSGAIREVVGHYLKVKGITDEAAIKMNYGRLAKNAKVLLASNNGDADKVNARISELGEHFKGASLSWTLETVIKNWGLVTEKPKSTGGW